MEATSDASLIDCEDFKSTGDHVIKLFGDSNAWKSNKRNTVSKSTWEAEHIAMSEASADEAFRNIIGKTMYLVTIWTDDKWTDPQGAAQKRMVVTDSKILTIL